jgi:hypothetical protein
MIIGKLPKLQPSCVELQKLMVHFNDVVCRNKHHPKLKMMVVKVDGQGLYLLMRSLEEA